MLLHRCQGPLLKSKDTGVRESATLCCVAGCGGGADGISAEPLEQNQHVRCIKGKNSLYKSWLSGKWWTQSDGPISEWYGLPWALVCWCVLLSFLCCSSLWSYHFSREQPECLYISISVQEDTLTMKTPFGVFLLFVFLGIFFFPPWFLHTIQKD